MQDYSNWLTKQQAADAIGVSTKTIEQLAQASKIQQARWKRPETGAHLSVYHPEDVERVRKERNPEAPPFVLPPSQNSENRVLAPRSNDSENSQSGVVLLAKMLEHISSQNSERSWPPPLWLTEEMAVAYSGLGAGHLATAVEWKRIGPRGAKVCRRSDLEKL